MDPNRTLDVRAVRAALTPRLGDARLDVQYLPATFEPFIVDPRFRAVLLGTLALTGLLLAAVGLFAVASADVTVRRYETGVRLALAQPPGRSRGASFRDTCKPDLIGVAAGLIFSYWLAQFFQASPARSTDGTRGRTRSSP